MRYFKHVKARLNEKGLLELVRIAQGDLNLYIQAVTIDARTLVV
jgi:hypothetical protein